jgi:hypothetical protein
MFDDQMPKQPTASASQPPVQDIFDDAPSVPTNLPIASSATADSSAKPSQESVKPVVVAQPTVPIQPTPVTPTQTPKMQTYAPIPPKSSFGKAIKVIVIILLALGIIGFAIYLAYIMMQEPVSVSEEPDVSVDEVDVIQNNNDEPVIEPQDQDSDGDGLTDAEESIFGTDPLNIDTDKDGLGDREEVQVYGTDPFNPDTDEDSYLDGQEVSAGYNPNGPGKLFELPK